MTGKKIQFRSYQKKFRKLGFTCPRLRIFEHTAKGRFDNFKRISQFTQILIGSFRQANVDLTLKNFSS